MTDVVMPQMGESIVEGTLTKWLKKPGDKVERDEPLFEISTDKVDTEIPSPVGRVRWPRFWWRKATTVAINTVVGRIDDGRRCRAAPAAPGCRAAAACRRRAGSCASCCRRRASAARRLAASRQRLAACRRSRGRCRRKPPGRCRRWCARWRAKQHRSEPGARHRRRRPHHQAGRGSVHRRRSDAPRPRSAPPPPPPAARAAAVAAPAAPQRRRRRRLRAPAAAPLARRSARGPRRTDEHHARRRSPSTWCFSKHTSAHVTTVHKVDMTKVAKMRERSQGRIPGSATASG